MIIYLAVLMDFFLGDPKSIPHPVIFVGKIVSLGEKIFYPMKNKKLAGFLFFFFNLAVVAAVIAVILYLAGLQKYIYFIVNLYLLYTSLSWGSLKKETSYPIKALEENNLDAARTYVSYVVGRDTENLNPEEVLEATIETVGENTIDGIIAPLFYMVIGYFCGLPLLFVYLYKTINTMDSMVGYKSEKYHAFGFAAAKIDDVFNYLPARIGAILMLLAGIILGYNWRNGWKIFKRDRYKHSSPNSGLSESIFAGLLGLRLGGPHTYFGEYMVKPYIGDALKKPEAADYRKSCRIMDMTVLLFMVLFLGLELILWI